jgi:MFS family permease
VSRLLADITPLRVSPHFRRLWWGLGLANVGAQFTVMAVSLQVYDITGSTAMVGYLGAAALIPLLAFGLYGGALADTYDRRALALCASVVMWLATLGLLAQSWLGMRSVWALYGLVAMQSGAAAINSPARGAIIPRLLKPALLPAGNALMVVTHTIALTAGPLLGALLVSQAGYTATYLVDAIAFAAALYALLRLPKMPPLRAAPPAPKPDQPPAAPPPAKGWRGVAQGFRFLARSKNVLMTFLVDMCAMVFAFPRALLPAVGAVMIGGGADTVGLLTASIAIGSALATVFSGPVARARWQGRVIAWSVGAWGGSVALFGVVVMAVGERGRAGTVWWALLAAAVALAGAGAADAVSAVLRGTILQVAAPDELRGRLQGVFFVVVAGGPRLGELLSGAGSTFLGEGGVAVLGGLVCIVAVIALMAWQRGFGRYDALHPVP